MFITGKVNRGIDLYAHKRSPNIGCLEAKRRAGEQGNVPIYEDMETGNYSYDFVAWV